MGPELLTADHTAPNALRRSPPSEQPDAVLQHLVGVRAEAHGTIVTHDRTNLRVEDERVAQWTLVPGHGGPVGVHEHAIRVAPDLVVLAEGHGPGRGGVRVGEADGDDAHTEGLERWLKVAVPATVIASRAPGVAKEPQDGGVAHEPVRGVRSAMLVLDEEVGWIEGRVKPHPHRSVVLRARVERLRIGGIGGGIGGAIDGATGRRTPVQRRRHRVARVACRDDRDEKQAGAAGKRMYGRTLTPIPQKRRES